MENDNSILWEGISCICYKRPVLPFPCRAEHKAGIDAERLQVVQSCRAVLAFSPVDVQEAKSELGIRVGEYCLVINQWHVPLCPRGDRQRSEALLWVT